MHTVPVSAHLQAISHKIPSVGRKEESSKFSTPQTTTTTKQQKTKTKLNKKQNKINTFHAGLVSVKGIKSFLVKLKVK